ncbi:hypothetical protein BAUCODRAFT_25605 [Baudoinia panamericana UAMH 10762]|uniref:DNA (cytosine-5-)-methyltransferase n=1 Tax=Baudoinia panamericana (strain UAMH 10762) TaxID=717646 RepID=M2N6K2_BAUPA|nr:uncharacterized protein BAUCODRAFT_25605 [Baudoinia panamericana UAMH 10762]EMC94405.1 hypothetical protein BAUCODRAFT_25605 [Baudoinia panamericana UAMH 10762]
MSSLSEDLKEFVPGLELIDLTHDNDSGDAIGEMEEVPVIIIDGVQAAADDVPTRYFQLEKVRTFAGAVLNVGDCAELADGHFLEVKRILDSYNAGLEVQLQGELYRRASDMNYMLLRRCNEVCRISRADEDDRAGLAGSNKSFSYPLSAVVALRRLIKTNQVWPACAPRSLWTDLPYLDTEDLKVRGPLVCRWEYVEIFDDHTKKNPSGAVLRRLHNSEASPGHGTAAAQLRKLWRGKLVSRISGNATEAGFKAKARSKRDGKLDVHIDLTLDEDEEPEEVTEVTVTEHYTRVNVNGRITKRTRPDSSITESYKRRVSSNKRRPAPPAQTNETSDNFTFTFGDLCAGAGGATCGAVQAGLKPSFALDLDPSACATYKWNNPNVAVEQRDITDFAAGRSAKWYHFVDVLHISFPCQPWSRAHTCQGKDDAKREALIWSVQAILQKYRPRIITLEEVDGLTEPRNIDVFRSLIHEFTQASYSVNWRTRLNCKDYGNAAERQRLFIIASGPGEPLPSFPKPTHGPGLKAFTSVRDALARSPNVIDLDMEAVIQRHHRPYDSGQPLKYTITTSTGIWDQHPDGKRGFSLQECALLQDFPTRYRFFGGRTSIRRQIGNAVPSCVAAAVFGEVVKTLTEHDARAAEEKTEPEVIDLESELEAMVID